MTWGMVAVGAAGVVGGAIAANGSRSAASAQQNAANQANATQQAMYDQTRADNMPALEARNASLAKMRELLGIGGNAGAAGYGSLSKPLSVGDVTQDPGYQFGLQQGQQTLNNQLAARGMLNSGAALKAAARYGTDYASTKYNEAWSRANSDQTNQFNRLASVAGYGQTGANQIAASGSNSANQIAANQVGVGNALGASQIAQGNTWANAGNQLAGWYAARQGSGGSAWSSSSPSNKQLEEMYFFGDK